MSVSEAQVDMRRGYCSGGSGILASAFAWSAAAVALLGPAHNAVWALLFGGMLIQPAAVFICKLMGARGTHTKGSPLGQLAGANTFWLIFCLPLAYALSLEEPNCFFPAMLLVNGAAPEAVFAIIFLMQHRRWTRPYSSARAIPSTPGP